MSKIDRLLGEGLFDFAALAAKGEIRNVEREITAKSGNGRTVLVQIKRVSIQGGTVLYTCRDVTELKLAEKELAATRLNLAHAARLALVGQLTASIMHEIQQPLMSIRLSSKAASSILQDQERAAKLDDLRQIFDDIQGGGESAMEITDRLRKLVRRRPLELRSVDLNEVASSVLRLVRADAMRRSVVLRADLAPSLPAIDADPISLQHVILDLIVNAMDVIDESEGERSVTVRTRAGADTVEIAVSDTGCGIPAEYRQKLFEAFFTTKTEGIGLGLVIARSIAEAHGGRIQAGEHSGRGATFRVTLPLRQPPMAASSRLGEKADSARVRSKMN